MLFASGADLQSINPLFTVHPLARQVQRYVLLTTLVQYDSSLTIRPYLARTWDWSDRAAAADLSSLHRACAGTTAVPTTARRRRLDHRAGPGPRHRVSPPERPGPASSGPIATDDSTLVLTFRMRQAGSPTS